MHYLLLILKEQIFLHHQKSIDDGSYSGTFSVPAKSQRFSTYLMLNRSNTKVLMEVEPNTNFNKKSRIFFMF